ncbi:MAG: amino acid adenylation domain-containing protein [Candidatus Aminicenantes bacterium]|jgi:amino acid adenylation domain-containing protein/non-ribosomal peptide synthase protein (TIGR01720 family)
MVTVKNISKYQKIASGQFFKEKEYWMNKLSGEFERSYFLYDYKKSSAKEGDKDIVTLKVSPELFARLMRISGGSYPQLHMILTAALVALLATYSGKEDIIVGTTIDKQDTEGPLINTILPLRVRLSPRMVFKELLLEVRKIINEAIENRNYPIESLVSQLDGTSSGSEFPLFDAAILLENIQDKKYIEHMNTSIIFSFRVKNQSIDGEVEYQAQLFKRKSIERIAGHFIYLLRDTLFDVERRIDEIDLLSEEDKKSFIDFNRTQVNFPMDKTIHQLFEQQVAATPDNIAIEELHTLRSLSYRELNNSANRLASRLKKKGAASGSIVGILVERSLEAIAAILGVLKAGGTYLPIDTVYPEERIKYMLEDSNAKILVTSPVLSEKFEKLSIVNCKLLMVNEKSPARRRLNNPLKETNSINNLQLKGNNLAYIIYTSGSTGKPKGVMIRHRSLVNYILCSAKNYVKNEKVNFPLFTSIAFDLTITSVFTPLVTGNAIVVYSGWEEGNLVEKIIDDNIVGVIKLTPSHLNLIRDNKIPSVNPSQEGNSFCKIKRFIVGGEKLDVQLARDISNNFNGNIEIYNEYGPTEATVGCMIYKFDPGKDYHLSVPIGKPLDNCQIYLLDGKRKPVPTGAVGEIYIAGAGVASGYLERPALTSERFVPNPFNKGKVMYRTGDLGRWLADGNIEFFGRKDHQVKIRGFRIELGEIESYLADYDDIKEAIVIARTPSGESIQTQQKQEKNLYAYFVSDKKLNVEKLRKYLLGKLPHYMLPLYYIQVEALPLTPNGKVDSNSLPDPPGLMNTEVEYQPPGNEKEEILTGIWQEVLGVDKIGINDSFFSLGGDSINALQIVARLQKCKLKLELRQLFEHPTISQLSKHIKSMTQIPYQGIVEGEVKLTPIQKWFFEKNFPGQHHFNQSVILYRQEGFDEKIIEKTFNKLVEHHDALRMVFKTEGTKIKQINKGWVGRLVDLKCFDLKEEYAYEKVIENKCNQIQSSIDLSKGTLVHLGLFKTINGDYLLITIHHLVIDGVSWRFLFEDFTSIYTQLQEGKQLENIELPLKTTSFKEWAEKLYEYANTRELLEEVRYWKQLEEIELLPLPKDRAAKLHPLKNSKVLSFELSEENTKKLLKEVNQAYNTEINDILLTALGAAVTDWTGAEKVTIVLEGHGREDIIEGINITRTIGWFTSVYPVVLDMRNRHDISTIIKDIKENLRLIPRKGIGYGILKYLTKEENKQDIEFQLKPEISFNYLGQFDQDINTDLFQTADISMGNSIGLNSENLYTLYISGGTTKEKLRMSVQYDTGEYDEETVQGFVNGFNKNLQQIIDHCLERIEREETELTLSDFSTAIEKQDAEVVFDILSEVTLED